MNLRTVRKTFQESHLSTADVVKVATLADGKFDDTVLYKLLSSLLTSFELYNPDNTVMIYLKQHSQALRWETKFDFRPPKEKERETNLTTRERTLPPPRKANPANEKAKRITSHPKPME
jgi:hypothetical protein